MRKWKRQTYFNTLKSLELLELNIKRMFSNQKKTQLINMCITKLRFRFNMDEEISRDFLRISRS